MIDRDGEISCTVRRPAMSFAMAPEFSSLSACALVSEAAIESGAELLSKVDLAGVRTAKDFSQRNGCKNNEVLVPVFRLSLKILYYDGE